VHRLHGNDNVSKVMVGLRPPIDHINDFRAYVPIMDADRGGGLFTRFLRYF
tara:strand:- start:39532 stop:39684 length:153 start_codon:yes stop_codon:yes gene_type:complete